MNNKKTFPILFTAVLLLFFNSTPCFAVSNRSDDGEKLHVQVNGQLVDFTDAQPVERDGRVMVPYRAVLESLGARVDYEEGSKTVSAAIGDTSISFVLSETELTVNRDGEIDTLAMDTAPFVSNGRAYVPARFAAEAFGFEVGWDQKEKTVVIINLDTITKDMQKDFSVLNKIARQNLEPETTYSSFEQVDEFVILNGVKYEGTTVTEMLLKGGSAYGVQKVDGVKDYMLTGPYEEIVVIDGETGNIFINSDYLSLSGGPEWWLISRQTLYEDYGFRAGDTGLFTDLLLEDIGDHLFEEVLLSETFALESVNIMNVNTYKNIQVLYNTVKALLGDEGLVKNGSVFKASLTENTILEVLSLTAESFQLEPSQYDSNLEEWVNYLERKLAVSVTVSLMPDGSLADYSIIYDSNIPEDHVFTFTRAGTPLSYEETSYFGSSSGNEDLDMGHTCVFNIAPTETPFELILPVEWEIDTN